MDLSVIYPNPEEAGTELGFEEIMAANRGWLDHAWDDEEEEGCVESGLVPGRQRSDENDDGHPSYNNSKSHRSSSRPSNRSREKLVIHQDARPRPLVDENGVALPVSQPREARGQKKKKMMMEVNETQISESNSSLDS